MTKPNFDHCPQLVYDFAITHSQLLIFQAVFTVAVCFFAASFLIAYLIHRGLMHKVAYLEKRLEDLTNV